MSSRGRRQRLVAAVVEEAEEEGRAAMEDGKKKIQWCVCVCVRERRMKNKTPFLSSPSL